MKQFTVICTRDEYDEVAEILQGWGYESWGKRWESNEDCVTTMQNGLYFTYPLKWVSRYEPRYNVEQLRTMENPHTETE